VNTLTTAFQREMIEALKDEEFRQKVKRMLK